MKSRFVILVLVLARFGITAWGAEDPARFRSVVAWDAQVTMRLSSAGNSPTVSWSVERSVAFPIRLSAGDLGLSDPFLLIWSGESNVPPTQFSVHDGMTLKLDPPTILTINGVLSSPFAPVGTAYLEINVTNGTYSVNFGAGYSGDAIFDGTALPALCGIPGTLPPFPKFTLPSTGMILSDTYTYPADRYCTASSCDDCVLGYAAAAGAPLIPGTVELTWNLQGISDDVEVIVEPSNYARWIPKGNLENPDQRGNSNKVSARLQKKGGGPTNVRAKALKFELVNVSKEPGVCMNFPVESPSTEPDLRFETELNQSLNPGATTRVVSPAEVEVSDPNPNAGIQSARVTVSCFDFGAYGKIRVSAEIEGRAPVVGHLIGDPQRSDVLLPKRQDSSFIADAWKKMPKVGAEGLADSSDEDDRPAGDGHSGDGYSLYEEYRGFSVNRTHVRTNPHRKDLFIYHSSDDSSKPDIRKFERLSGLLIHDLLRKDEISEFNVMNINHGSNPNHLHDQTGIRMVVRQEIKDFCEAAARELNARHPTTPGATLQVEIDPAGLVAAQMTFLENGAVDIYLGDNCVAHELAHACSVYHHGEEDLGKVTWVGTLSLDNPPRPIVLEIPPTRQVTIRRENGDNVDFEMEAPLTENGLKVAKPNVAVPHGQHSGDPQCIMRYGAATAYLRDASDVRYVIPLDRAARTSLCTSPSSSGISATRYGDAHAKRGNCKDQICVNDKYKDHAKHDRTYPLQQW
ncbi:MAG: hypothetical protein DME22_13980 [Verrucomicrobia bacterium]|nr:MAG: hypothetical protein DME22_13980 [Verrucomicrobiota bacterium]